MAGDDDQRHPRPTMESTLLSQPIRLAKLRRALATFRPSPNLIVRPVKPVAALLRSPVKTPVHAIVGKAIMNKNEKSI